MATLSAAPRRAPIKTLKRLGRAARLGSWLFRPAQTSEDRDVRDEARFRLLQLVGRALMRDGYVVTDYRKLWWEDREFLAALRRLDGGDSRTADRKFFLLEMLRLVEHLPGQTAEAGVFRGASSWFICDRFTDSGKTHYAFDSFEGLSTPGPEDGFYWRERDFHAPEETAREALAPFKVEIRKGWIPDVFSLAEAETFCFVHIDVDLYEPTLESMRFFYPRMVSGGIILADDYGLSTCPGATRAVDEFMRDKPETVVHVPTGQGFLVKA
jgi:O-methyltransferase